MYTWLEFSNASYTRPRKKRGVWVAQKRAELALLGFRRRTRKNIKPKIGGQKNCLIFFFSAIARGAYTYCLVQSPFRTSFLARVRRVAVCVCVCDRIDDCRPNDVLGHDVCYYYFYCDDAFVWFESMSFEFYIVSVRRL